MRSVDEETRKDLEELAKVALRVHSRARSLTEDAETQNEILRGVLDGLHIDSVEDPPHGDHAVVN